MDTLGVILARGGSKRCPGKNIRDLGDMPLIGWTIWAGLLALCIDTLVVSSDDECILSVAGQFNVGTLERPDELATDEASSYPAILHALDSIDYSYKYVALLQPTSPFRNHTDIDACMVALLESDYPAAASFEEGVGVPNGGVYIARVDWLRDTLGMGVESPFDGPAVSRYHMPRERSIDIDTEKDFAMAKLMVGW